MEKSAMTPDSHEEIVFKLLALSVAARGWVAFAVAVPVAIILLAVAWRIIRPRRKPSTG
jgi:hypothetical protein